MEISIRLLNDLSYSLGLIGLAELQERIEVADWLADETGSILDPRRREGEPLDRPISELYEEAEVLQPNPDAPDFAGRPLHRDAQRWAKFLLLKKWHFTLGDVDCVPSVPHGHESAKTQAWPKINPYTGRVFTGMHQEDLSQRLDKGEMRNIWRNKDFVEHCRKQVLWFADKSPSYQFSRARHGRLHFPQW